ncbi:hypothetical protein [Sphingobacterium hungaricum]
MRTLYIFLIASICMLSCSKDETNELIGDWQLVEVQSPQMMLNGRIELVSKDFRSENIMYSFISNNTLRVTGASHFAYEPGTYSYELIDSHATFKTSKGVIIENTDWVLGYREGLMVLDKSYVDGPQLLFEKK